MPRSVLLVDDDRNVLSALRRALHREPYRVLTAECADAAFALLEKEPIEVVVSDQEMPGMPGTVFLARVQAAYPDTVRMMLTGHGSLEVAIRATNDGGVYRFFTKPCNPVELAVAIRQGLQHQDLLRESRRLLQTVRRQSALINEIEREWGGLTRVERDEFGAIVVQDSPADLDALVKEVQAAIEAADEKLHARELAWPTLRGR